MLIKGGTRAFNRESNLMLPPMYKSKVDTRSSEENIEAKAWSRAQDLIWERA